MWLSSEEEEAIEPQLVTNYHFVNDRDAPIAFSLLPFQWDGAKKPDLAKGRVFLHGTADGGQKIYKLVSSWKLGLLGDRPEFSVLTKDGKWINLVKPRKIYEDRIRTILVTAEWLHYLRGKPEASRKCLLDHLSQVFGSFDAGPYENDLRAHLSLIQLFAERDKSLAKSQLLLMFLEEKPWKRISSGEAFESNPDIRRPSTCNNIKMDKDTGDADGDEYENESALFDSVCAICDNGGEILCCEGRCLRSFHATKDAGADSACKSLGYSSVQVEAIQNFLCKNCQYKQHQCFGCGKLGSSDKVAGAKVFRCISATCGHFYHPSCVAKLLFPKNEAEAAVFKEKIAAGESFMCPVHRCLRCKEGENKTVNELQFAICRRCPKTYHRKCLPRRISFQGSREEGIAQRAWNDLLPNRILMYCRKHKIDAMLGTPTRDHILYPEVPERNKVMDVRKFKVRALSKKVQISDEGFHIGGPSVKPTSEELSGAEERDLGGKSVGYKSEQVLDFNTKLKPSKESTQFESSILPSKKARTSDAAVYPTSTGKKFISSFPVINGETEKKIMALMEEASTSLTLEDIMSKRTMPSTHAYSSRHIDKITEGKVEGSVEAIRTALKRLQDGNSIVDAKAVCEPGIIHQIPKWRTKLKTYLLPFLIVTRYTSFGRHFTKTEKLKEIVDMLQAYVQNGDTIVDFCCGSNDFSTLMKEKLDKVGKTCSFRNYDLIQPKNDFNFEKRDWMTVQPEELPDGSTLIMGLNPPFGVKASLANMFIDKALSFMPKLVILIVPKEAKRLDAHNPYDLIWEDCKKLSGKSFYLPGSVDVYDKQLEQWNLKPPPLSLWSRIDWTAEHLEIATKHGHLSTNHQVFPAEETRRENVAEDIMDIWSEDHKRPPEMLEDRSPKRITPERNEVSKVRDEGELSDMSISPPDSRSGVRYQYIDADDHAPHLGAHIAGCSDPGLGQWGPLAPSTFAVSATQTCVPSTSDSNVLCPGIGSYLELHGAWDDTPSDSMWSAPDPLPSFSRQGSSGGLDQ